jgi:hypothetical protein
MLLQDAAAQTLRSPSYYVPALQYAPDEGSRSLRENLAVFLTCFYRPGPPRHGVLRVAEGRSKSPIDVARIAITGGASQSLSVLLGVATDPAYTRGVWAIEPTYFLACRIFDDAGLRVRGVPDGEGGVDLAALRERLEEAERKRRDQLNGAVDQPVCFHFVILTVHFAS